MIETNISIVMPGPDLYLDTRCAEVGSQDLSPDLLQRACNALRKRHGLAAVPSPEGLELLVAAWEPITPLVLQGDDWRVEVKDSGRTRRLRFAEPEDAPLLAQLLERCLLVEIGRRTSLWTLDSPRIWYEPTPFKTANDIAAYRRFEVSGIPIESIGIGLVVDVGTAFFTVPTVADFFRDDLPEHERKRLRERFEFLSERQRGQKGTLLYDVRQSKHKCYFEEFLRGVTCATTGKLRVRGRDYDSLLDYYRREYPHLSVGADDPVARVSFPSIDRPQPVAGNRLRLRVMNEALPNDLNQVDKISPPDRCALIEGFWARLGDYPLGRDKPRVAPHFWQPDNDRAVRIKPPDLMFADGQVVSAPHDGSLRGYQKYYHQRHALLRKVGCLRVPPAVARLIHVAVPNKAEEAMVTRLAEGITARLSKWTRKQITSEVVMYDSLDGALSRLRLEVEPGIVVFVFEDDDPAAYFAVSYELKAWRVKRITYANLEIRFRRLQLAKNGVGSGDGKLVRAVRDWQSFIEMSALDVLQQLDCVPWGLAGQLHYEAQLAIDVGADRRHFALSLLICRPQPAQPSFWLDTVVRVKSDPKHETINEVVLRDEIVALFKRAQGRRFDPLCSVLALRDGRECGRELEGIAAAREELIRLGLLDKEARMDVVDVHKRSVKGIRLWDRSQGGQVRHALEGRALLLDKRTVVIANTGAATLHQGTAEPIMLVARGEHINMIAAATDMHATSHLNYSSPGVAGRLPLVLKRTDDELKSRAAQEIRRIR